jgi:hypothetical protein
LITPRWRASFFDNAALTRVMFDNAALTRV